jgi:hypothetical protein
VAAAIEQSSGLLHGMSHGLMSGETIEAVPQSAWSSAGVRLLTQERVALMTLAGEAHRALKEFKKAKLAVEPLSTSGAAQRLPPTTTYHNVSVNRQRRDSADERGGHQRGLLQLAGVPPVQRDREGNPLPSYDSERS